MLKHKFFILLLVPLIFTACTNPKGPLPIVETESLRETSINDHQIIEYLVGDNKLFVEAVTSAESITKGLGDRDEIGSDGMLFVLPEKRVVTFWMHGMRFPLDMVWIDENKIVGIEKNVPAPADPSSTALPVYSSQVPVTHVLELPAGKADELELQMGMVVKY